MGGATIAMPRIPQLSAHANSLGWGKACFSSADITEIEKGAKQITPIVDGWRQVVWQILLGLEFQSFIRCISGMVYSVFVKTTLPRAYLYSLSIKDTLRLLTLPPARLIPWKAESLHTGLLHFNAVTRFHRSLIIAVSDHGRVVKMLMKMIDVL